MTEMLQGKINPGIFCVLAPHSQRFPSLTIVQAWHDVNTEFFVSFCVTAGWALQVLSTSRRGVHPQEIQATPNQIPGSFEEKEKRNQIKAEISRGRWGKKQQREDQTGKHLARVWMKGHWLNSRIEMRVNGWLKGNKWQEQSHSLKNATNEPFEGARKPTVCKGERNSTQRRDEILTFCSEGKLQQRPHQTLRRLLIRRLYDDSYWPTCMLHLSLSACLSSGSCRRMPLMAVDQYARSERPVPSSTAHYRTFFFT